MDLGVGGGVLAVGRDVGVDDTRFDGIASKLAPRGVTGSDDGCRQP